MITVAALLAASTTFGITAIVVSSRSVTELKVSHGSGTGGNPGGPLPSGALVPAADLVSDPVFVNSTVGFALETTEHRNVAVERLARSADGGRTWRVTGSAFSVEGLFTTLQFTSPSDGYIFGPAGLLVTTDGGATWSQVQGLNGTLQRAIPLPTPGGQLNVWATYTSCGNSPPGPSATCSVGVAISTDSGRHWHDVSAPGLREARDGGDIIARWSIDAAYVLSYGITGGGLAYTADDGLTWQHLDDPCAGTFAREDLAAPPPPASPGATSALWLICGAVTADGAGGQPKLVYRSFDDAKHWQLVASTGFAPGEPSSVGELPLSGSVSQLATIDATRAWLGVRGLGLIVTFDSGRTWQLADGIPTTEPDTEVGVTFNSGTLGWVIVFRKGVWRTENALHWTLMDGG